MKVLVTGGAGFIGSHVVDLLLKKGYNVSIVDDLSTGRVENLNTKAKFFNLDICDKKLRNVFKKEKFDFVVHHAAHINVRNSVKNPMFDANSNILGSINLLECCRDFKIRKIVYASTGGAIYGEPEYLPADEKHPVKPLCPYGISKHVVEHYLELYQKLYGINFVALRYANVYGPRQDPLGEAGVVAIFTGKYLKNEIPTIFGDGKQTRDFVYVRDVAESNLLSLEKNISGIFNIGTGIETSVNDLSKKLEKITKSKVKAKHGSAVPGEVRRIALDIKLAKKVLGWRPKIKLDAGMKETVEWTRKNQ